MRKTNLRSLLADRLYELGSRDWHKRTASALARHVGCSVATARKHLGSLVSNGEASARWHDSATTLDRYAYGRGTRHVPKRERVYEWSGGEPKHCDGCGLPKMSARRRSDMPEVHYCDTCRHSRLQRCLPV